MPYINTNNLTLYDLLELCSEYNSFPEADKIVTFGVSKAEWRDLIMLKELNYRGIGGNLVITDEVSGKASYKNIPVYFTGNEEFKLNQSNIRDTINYYKRLIDDLRHQTRSLRGRAGFNWDTTNMAVRGSSPINGTSILPELPIVAQDEYMNNINF